MAMEEGPSEVKAFKPSANYAFRMTKQQIFKMKQIFDAYDDDYDGIIGMEFLANAMRGSGLVISNQEIADTKKALADEGVVDTIEMSRFFILMATKFRDAHDMDKVVVTSFKSIYNDPDDPLTKTIPIKVLRTKLAASGGEQLEDEEIDSLLHDIPHELLSTDGNKADYDGLIHWLLQDLPDLVDEDESEMENQAEKDAGLETGGGEGKGEGEGEAGGGEG